MFLAFALCRKSVAEEFFGHCTVRQKSGCERQPKKAYCTVQKADNCTVQSDPTPLFSPPVSNTMSFACSGSSLLFGMAQEDGRLNQQPPSTTQHASTAFTLPEQHRTTGFMPSDGLRN
ncbi:unnamed protein product [Bursaphelenchus xylophilus]|uniref:(pine wood nematode) hypothetical protein n=1 Tax=Bursaphelenchus xylophilus TaxID=6326 RepID=A0A7I8X898_BURXY|nr:unnamed protein product [Bursaphelenchus xylophilus]CAG9126606.1 unnamed protein product [Bursaphelenchus xylophilus]